MSILYADRTQAFGLWFNSVFWKGEATGRDKVLTKWGVGIPPKVKEAIKVLLGYQLGTLPSDVEDIWLELPKNVTEMVFNSSPLYYALNSDETKLRVGFYYSYRSVLSRPLSERSYYLYDSFTINNDFLTRSEEILANRSSDAIVTVNGKRVVTDLTTGVGGVHSKQSKTLVIAVRIYPITKTTIRVVDRRGVELTGSVKLTNRDTGRSYDIVLSSSKTVNISSGVYTTDVRVLVHKETHNATITVLGGVLTIRLNADFRAITGETVRVLLLYIPVALLIPIILMTSSIPFLVRKMKRGQS